MDAVKLGKTMLTGAVKDRGKDGYKVSESEDQGEDDDDDDMDSKEHVSDPPDDIDKKTCSGFQELKTVAQSTNNGGLQKDKRERVEVKNTKEKKNFKKQLEKLEWKRLEEGHKLIGQEDDKEKPDSTLTKQKEAIAKDVIKSRSFPKRDIYRCFCHQTGYALIVCFTKNRKGADIDIKNTTKLVETLGFKLKVVVDPTYLEFYRKMEETTKYLNSEASSSIYCFIFFLSGHGYSTGILTDDRKIYPFYRIYGPFGNSLENFKGKPRAILFDCCRIEPHLNSNDNRPNISVDDQVQTFIKENEDIFIAFSTQHGKKSGHHPTFGSIFTNTVVKVFIDDEKNPSFVKLMRKGRGKTTERSNYDQVPAYSSSLQKQFFLPRKHSEATKEPNLLQETVELEGGLVTRDDSKPAQPSTTASAESNIPSRASKLPGLSQAVDCEPPETPYNDLGVDKGYIPDDNTHECGVHRLEELKEDPHLPTAPILQSSPPRRNPVCGSSASLSMTPALLAKSSFATASGSVKSTPVLLSQPASNTEDPMELLLTTSTVLQVRVPPNQSSPEPASYDSLASIQAGIPLDLRIKEKDPVIPNDEVVVFYE